MGGGGDNKGERKRLRESRENGENPVITGPKEDMGIPNGTNGITKMGTRGPQD